MVLVFKTTHFKIVKTLLYNRSVFQFYTTGMPCDLATIVDSANFLNWVRNMEKVWWMEQQGSIPQHF